jgi:hypothetical protein
LDFFQKLPQERRTNMTLANNAIQRATLARCRVRNPARLAVICFTFLSLYNTNAFLF